MYFRCKKDVKLGGRGRMLYIEYGSTQNSCVDPYSQYDGVRR
jgi:hypothetical protein